MKRHTFTLILERPREIGSRFEDAVFEAGCGDAALGQRGATVYLEFDRHASGFLEALVSAIGDVHRIPGARVAHVDPDALVTAAEIADRIGRTRESVRLLAKGARGPGGFPEPISGAGGRRIRLWRWSEVAQWLAAHGIWSGGLDEAQAIAAVNGALALTRHADPAERTEIMAAVT